MNEEPTQRKKGRKKRRERDTSAGRVLNQQEQYTCLMHNHHIFHGAVRCDAMRWEVKMYGVAVFVCCHCCEINNEDEDIPT